MKERCSVLETTLKSEIKRKEMQINSLGNTINKNHQYTIDQLKQHSEKIL